MGPADPITVLAAKSRTTLPARLQLTSLLSFAAFIAIYWAASGMKFGIGFAVLILIHEMGHFIDIKRRGLPADMPVFLPGLGAYVRWQALGVPLETRAAISLAGPLAGFLASLACAAIWWQTGNPLWAALARSGAILNLLNLIPVWVLDGGQAALALSKTERIVLLIACVALGLVFGQNLFFLVALGAGYRAFFAADLPAQPSRATTVYFIAVLTALGVIIRLMPGQGLGLN
jgi:Zn-dependent protease